MAQSGLVKIEVGTLRVNDAGKWRKRSDSWRRCGCRAGGLSQSLGWQSIFGTTALAVIAIPFALRTLPKGEGTYIPN